MKSFASFATCILALTISIAQAQPPQKSKPRRLKVPGGVLQGTAIKQVTPPYPPIARAARVAGKVEKPLPISSGQMKTLASNYNWAFRTASHGSWKKKRSTRPSRPTRVTRRPTEAAPVYE